MQRLIITNGDSAAGAIKETGIHGEILPWRDVLHDGPVPQTVLLAELSKIRTQFIADLGWGTYADVLDNFEKRDKVLMSFKKFDEIVLWFEHDLYDQLQLLQLLAWFADHTPFSTPIFLICKNEFVAETPLLKLPAVFAARQPITNAQLALGKSAWEAFCATAPALLMTLLRKNMSTLPFLKSALIRLCEEYPNAESGLSRNEQQILEVTAAGPVQPGDLFKAVQKLETARYLGDWSFWEYVRGLSHCKQPLLATASGNPFLPPAAFSSMADFNTQKLILTPAGKKVWGKTADHVQINGINKWIGGTHLNSESMQPIWRWHSLKKEIEQR